MIFGTHDAVNEGNTATYRCTLFDESGRRLQANAITAITATLTDVKTDTIVNSRDSQDVLNANGGTLDSNGRFELILGAADNVIVTGTHKNHKRHLLLTITYTGEDLLSHPLTHEVIFYVRNLANI